MEVAPFFVDFHHFLSIFTIFYRFSRFTHFCRDLHFVAIYALFLQIFLAKIAISATLHVFCMYGEHTWWNYCKEGCGEIKPSFFFPLPPPGMASSGLHAHHCGRRQRRLPHHLWAHRLPRLLLSSSPNTLPHVCLPCQLPQKLVLLNQFNSVILMSLSPVNPCHCSSLLLIARIFLEIFLWNII